MITDLDEETRELDWFAVDQQGEIAHFTTDGRGFIPASVKHLGEDDFESLRSCFRNRLPQRSDAKVAAAFALHQLTFRSQENRETYLRVCLEMARRGLYSYDCVVQPTRPSEYFLVAEPIAPLRIDALSVDIRAVLERTRCGDAFLDCSTITPEQIA